MNVYFKNKIVQVVIMTGYLHNACIQCKGMSIPLSLLSVANKERPVSPPKQEKAPASSASTAKGKAKGGKEKGGKDKDKDTKGSRPPSQSFDITKPHWTLRVVSDAVAFVSISIEEHVKTL